MAGQEQSAPQFKVRSSKTVEAHTEFETSPKDHVAPKQTFTKALKTAQEVNHHLFKLKYAKFMANSSYKKDNPVLTPMEHAHIYHTVDSMGRPQEFCGYVGGHTHRVKVIENADGTLSVECGPPLKKQTIKDRAGRNKSKMVPVKFFDKFAGADSEEVDENGEPISSGGRWIVDDHKHDLEYGRMEVWTVGDIQSRGGKMAASLDDGLNKQRDLLKSEGVSIK